MQRMFLLMLVAMGNGVAAPLFPAQVPSPDALLRSFRDVDRVTRVAGMEHAFAWMEREIREPVRDRTRYRHDISYRREFETQLRKLAERRKQLALRFLDRHVDVLDEGVGLYYRGLALGLAGDPHAAFLALQAFRLRTRNHPVRNKALVAIVDCLLQDRPDNDAADQRERDKKRLARARGFLSTLDRQELSPEEKKSAVALRARFEAQELRMAFLDLVEGIRKREHAIVLDGVDKDLMKKLKEKFTQEALAVLVENLGVRPDEVAYHNSPEKREAYWKVRRRADRERREAVRDFYRTQRDRLEHGDGLLWKARALALAGDAERAAHTFRKFLDEAPGHPEATAARVELAGLLVRELKDREAAFTVLEELAGEVLDEPQSRTVQAMTERMARCRELQQALPSLVGKPWPFRAGESQGSSGSVSGSTRQDLLGRVSVIVVFATWSEPCRKLLARMTEKPVGNGISDEQSKTIRVVGLSGLCGFGWKATGRDQSSFSGTFAGDDLTPEQERELANALWKIAGFTGPVVFLSPGAFERFPVLPALLVVDPEGVVRFAGSGVEVWPEARQKARALAGEERE
jgi:tetratricopeptide (TPR) repeat protein